MSPHKALAWRTAPVSPASDARPFPKRRDEVLLSFDSFCIHAVPVRALSSRSATPSPRASAGVCHGPREPPPPARPDLRARVQGRRGSETADGSPSRVHQGKCLA